MINTFQEWSAAVAENGNMSQLRGAALGIEAADYLDRLEKFNIPDLARPVKEALLPALGGVPFGLKYIIRETIKTFRRNGITPIFVFSGLDAGKKDVNSSPSAESQPIITNAWQLYDNLDADGAVEHFRMAKSVTPEDLFRFLQTILREEGVEFHVAPYGAAAQLAYFYQAQFIDAISGSSEVLLYDAPEVITNWDFKANECTWVRRQNCLAELGNISSDTFIDACLLCGTSFLPTFPPLENTRVAKLKAAVDMIISNGRGGYGVCKQYAEDQAVSSINYLDKYMKARLSIKHHVVMTKEGKVEPLNVDSAPSDIHEFISYRVGEELYYYLSRGVISPRIVNWMVSQQILVPPPLDLGESQEYRQLVREQLNPIREKTLKLLAMTNHRFYQNNKETVRCWFLSENESPTLDLKSVENQTQLVASWNVPEAIYGPEKNKYLGNGLIGIALKSLKDKEFYPKTVVHKDVNRLLNTKEEILFNSLWRMFTVLGYINRDHSLSPWGQVLQATLAALPKQDNPAAIVELEEAAVVAVELLRLGLLNANNMFPNYSGAPYRGNEAVKRNTMLVARVACLGKLGHQEIGYTGPLSRNFLGFHSMVSAVRNMLRDLTEVCLVTLLAHGDATRKREDYTDLGLDLPFLINNDCGLALAVNAYLNDVVATTPGPNYKQNVVQHHASESFKYALDYANDLKKAFNLWDAVYAGVKSAGADEIKDKKAFEEANKWLSDMRVPEEGS